MLNRGSYFSGQEVDEEIIYFVRRHWLAIFPWIIVIFTLLVSQIIFIIIFWDSINTTFLSAENIELIVAGRQLYSGPYVNLTIILLSSYLLFIFALILTIWISYYLDVTFITSRHLVNIRQNGIFNRQVAEQPLSRVQDVSSKMQGFLQTFFRFGTVFVETAGEAPNFRMVNIPRPHKMANTIMKMHERSVSQASENKNKQESKIDTSKIKSNPINQPNVKIDKLNKTTLNCLSNLNQDVLSEKSDNQKVKTKVDSLINLAKQETVRTDYQHQSENDRSINKEGDLEEGKQIIL